MYTIFDTKLIVHLIPSYFPLCPVTVGTTFNKTFTIYYLLRLTFTSDGVVVGVVIRSVERHDLVKIKPTESEAENTDSVYDSVAYDQVKTALSEPQTVAEE